MDGGDFTIQGDVSDVAFGESVTVTCNDGFRPTTEGAGAFVGCNVGRSFEIRCGMSYDEAAATNETSCSYDTGGYVCRPCTNVPCSPLEPPRYSTLTGSGYFSVWESQMVVCKDGFVGSNTVGGANIDRFNVTCADTGELLNLQECTCPLNTVLVTLERVGEGGETMREDFCVCDQGFYGFGGLDCSSCPVNTISSVGTQSISGCLCDRGYWGQGGECNLCPSNMTSDVDTLSSSGCFCTANYYGGAGDSNCTRCTENSVSPQGSTFAGECRCDEGMYGSGIEGCRACPAFSTWQDVTLENGIFVARCTCDPGYYGNQSIGCTPCPDNSMSLQSDSRSIEECQCMSGFYGSGANDCIRCPNGAFSNADSLYVTDCFCDQFNYEDEEGNCFPCPANAVSVRDGGYGEGIESCRCMPGYYGTVTNATVGLECFACPTLSSSALGSSDVSECVCEPGTLLEIDQLSLGESGMLMTIAECIACVPGKYWSSNPPQHGNELEDGWWMSYEGTFECSPCPADSSSFRGAISVDECECSLGFSGFSWCDGQECGPCLACDPGSYKDTVGNTGQCSACPDFSTSPIQSEAVEECHCVAGYEGDNGGPCNLCPEGTYKPDDGPALCTDLPFFASAVQPVPTSFDCNAGYYHYYGDLTDTWAVTFITEWIGLNDLDMWPLFPQYTSCIPCSEGTFKSTSGPGTCQACPENSNSMPPGQYGYPDHPDSCICNPGYTLKGGTCVQCSAGKVKDLHGNFACNNCPAHTTSPIGTDTYDLCTCIAGWYEDGGSCLPCEEGTFKDWIGNEECTECPYGSHTDDPATSDELKCLCDKGWSGAGGEFCTQCPANTYKDMIGTSECLPCPSESSSPVESTSLDQCLCNVGREPLDGECVPCGEGTFKDWVGNELCTTCPQEECTEVGIYRSACGGAMSGECSLECVDKPPFSTFTSGAAYEDHCHYDVDCPNGTIPEYGTGFTSGDVVSCACQAGYASLNERCIACTPGTFKSEAGPGLCQPCPENTYSESSASTGCSPCQNYSSSSASSSSVNDCICLTGYEIDYSYSDLAPGPMCTLCPGGQTSDGQGGPCSPCGTNQYSLPLVGCIDCSEDTVTNSDGGSCVCRAGLRGDPSACEPCPANTYSAAGTMGDCTPCEGDSSSVPGSQQCICNAGFSSSPYQIDYSFGNGNPPCFPCPAGSESVAGSSSCTPCPQGWYQDGPPFLCVQCRTFATTRDVGSTSESECFCDDGFEDDGGVCKPLCPALNDVLPNAAADNPGEGSLERLDGFNTTVSCNAGFMLSSTTPSVCGRQATLTCGGDGTWSPSPAGLCKQMSCPLPALDNALAFPEPSLPSFESVTVYCNTGYILSEPDNDMLTCTANACALAPWDNACVGLPCFAFAALPNVIPSPVSKRVAVYDENITQTCTEGFAVKGTESSTCLKKFYPKCLLRQTFDQSDVDMCRPVKCPPFRESVSPSVKAGIVQDAVSTSTPPYGSTITVTCREGYVPLNKVTLMPCGLGQTHQARCGAADSDGSVCAWANECECRPANCGNYTIPPFSSLNDIDYSPGKVYFANDFVSIRCNDGYMASPYAGAHPRGVPLSGCSQVGNAVCQRDGTFSPMFCVPQVCTHTFSITAGQGNAAGINVTSSTIFSQLGDKAQLFCARGFSNEAASLGETIRCDEKCMHT